MHPGTSVFQSFKIPFAFSRKADRVPCTRTNQIQDKNAVPRGFAKNPIREKRPQIAVAASLPKVSGLEKKL
jgi:hypothetical protein